jgi:hypothetical protein
VNGDNGILSTPVVDPSTGLLYLVARGCDPDASATPSCRQTLFAIDVADGAIVRQIDIAGSIAAEGGVLAFDPNHHWNRPGLLLAAGHVFVAFGAGPNGSEHEEDIPYHGFLIGYDAGDFTAPPSVFATTTSRMGGGIWQAGTGPSADDDALYFVSGNSVFGGTTHAPDAFPAAPVETEDSLVTLPLSDPNGHPGSVASHYWDSRAYKSDGDVFQYMESNDIDLGMSGALLVPGSRDLVSGGKSGIVYLVDRDTMQEVEPPLSAFTAPPLPTGATLYIETYNGGPHFVGAPVFERPADAGDGDDADEDGDAGRGNEGGDASGSGRVYAWPQNDRLTELLYDYEARTLTPGVTANVPALSSGGVLAVSSNAGANGLVWAATALAAGSGGHLWAFDAATLAPLWGADTPHYAKFTSPTIARGRVFLAATAPGASDDAVLVYGLPSP